MVLLDHDAPDSSADDGDSESRSTARRIWICRTALLLVVIFLLLRAWRSRVALADYGGLTIENSADVAWWLAGIAWRQLVQFTAFGVLGALLPSARLAHSNSPPDGQAKWFLRLACFAAAGVLVATCSWVSVGERPHLGAFFVPLLGYLLGWRLGAAWQRGTRAFVWSAAQVALLPLMLIVLGIAGFKLAIVDAPLDFEPVRMTETEKHRLTQWIRDTRPAEGAPRQLRLTDGEIDALCNVALERGLAARKAQINSQPQQIALDASIVLPERLTSQRHFLNVHLAGLVRIDDGRLQLRCDRLEVGRIAVPRVFLWVGAPVVRALLLDDPQVREIVGSVQLLEPQAGAIQTVFRPGALSHRVVPALVQLIWDRPDVSAQTEVYVRQLIQTFHELPADSDRFGGLLESAFTLAAERSIENDPLLENRAAIFALAILFGQHDLEPLVGEILDSKLRAEAAPLMGVVTLRDRHDWPRHFLVSAALALLSSEQASDRVGVFKEQIDSQQGGSGFSFGDLLADRAGTRFALVATRDEPAARALQSRLTAGFHVDDFFPSADGLPEGIPDAEFESPYGGVDGAGYRALSDEIDRRLESLPAI